MKTVNKKKRNYIVGSLVTATLLLTGCSGGGDSTSSTTSSASSTERTTPLTTGTFVDDPVIGLNYSCEGGITGVTNDAGEYTCPTGEDVTFAVGAVNIGTLSTQGDIITPFSFFPNDEDSALNLARLLQTVDDGSVPGKLKLDSILKTKVPADTDFSDADFTSAMQVALGRALVEEEVASENMSEAIALAGGKVASDDNYFPVAYAGEDIFTTQGSTVNLDASQSSDADGDTLTYLWELTLKPEGSTATLSDDTSVTPSFEVDVDGRYVVQLTVNDTISDSTADSVRVHTNITEYNKLYHSVTTGDSDDTITVTKELAKGAIIDTGAGADTLVLDKVSAKYIQVLTGDGEDSLTLKALRDSLVDTGADNDTLNIKKIDSGDSVISTGDGDDNVTLISISSGYDDGSVNLGSGDDTLTIYDSLSGTESIFDGGEGNNTLILPNLKMKYWDRGIKNIFVNFENITFKDGALPAANTGSATTPNNDNITIIEKLKNSSLDTGDGDDVVNIKTLRDSDLRTGLGDDTLIVKKIDSGSATIDTGAGNDNVTLVGVSGGYDNGSVNLGEGEDLLTINDSLSGTDSIFNGGDGYDVLTLTAVNLKYWDRGKKDLFTNFDRIELNDGTVFQIAPILETVRMDVDEDVAEATLVGSISILDAGTSAITSMTLSGTGHENFSVAANGDVSVALGANLDFTQVLSYKLFVHASNTSGSSAKVSVVIDVNEVLITGETLNIDTLSNSNIQTDIGDDTLIINRIEGSTATINTVAGDDHVTLSDVSSSYDNGTVNLGEGDDILIIHDDLSGTESSFNGGDGYDTLVLTKIKLKYWDLGKKDLFSNFERIELSEGTIIQLVPVIEPDILNVDANSPAGTLIGTLGITTTGASAITSITLTGIGHENFNVALNGDVTLAVGATLNSDVTPSYSLTAHASNANGTSEVSVEIDVYQIGDGDDIVSIKQLKNTSIETGLGDDTLIVKRIERGNATIDTGAGNDNATLVDVSGGYDSGTLTLGDGEDRLTINDNLSGTLSTFDGGSGYDTLVLTEVSLAHWNSSKADLFSNFDRIELRDGEVIQIAPLIEEVRIDVDENVTVSTLIGKISIAGTGTSAIISITLTGEGNEKFSVATNGDVSIISGADLNYTLTPAYRLHAYATNTEGTSPEVSVVIDVNEIVIAGEILNIAKLENTSVQTDIGDDIVIVSRVDGGHATIDTNAGNDNLTLINVSGGYDNGSVNLGDGDDRLTINDSLSGTKSSFNGGAGNDTLILTEVSSKYWYRSINELFSNFERIELSDGTVLVP